MKPTDEQAAALELFMRGDSMVIEAGAGTGKTSTLQLLAASTRRRGRYLAFNKAIVTDVAGKMPDRVAASTAHSLAFRAVGTRYSHRLGSGRMKSSMIAQRLDIRHFVARTTAGNKVLQEGFLGGLAMRAITIFCQTLDTEPSPRHVPYVDGIDLPDKDGNRTWDNNRALREHLAPALRKAWGDITNTDGQLPFRHDHYLKLWQLSHPTIDTDFILFDEAQDANPVMAGVVGEQEHAQRVYVGDSAQAIYEFTGAVNALDAIDAQHRRHLTQSFRFGVDIAAAANVVLETLDAPIRLKGLDTIPSIIRELGEDERPDSILCRTNAKAVETILAWKARGTRPHLVGGGTEVASFARAAKELQQGQPTYHPELACFGSWGEVQDYVAQDAQGAELRLLVRLVDDYGVPTILSALERMPTEHEADLIISTAHKAKGREWPIVQIADDFAEIEQTTSELRLRYVAITRARSVLDDTALHAGADDGDEPALLPTPPA